MKTTTKQVLTVMHIVTWIIFIGLCIQAGATLVSGVATLAFNPEGAKKFYMAIDLSGLYNHSVARYVGVVSLLVSLSALKACIFYYIIKIFLKINMVHPFSEEVGVLISKVSYTALAVGLIGIGTHRYSKWLVSRGVEMPSLGEYIGGSDEFLFLAAIVFVISQVFKRGIEMQSEQELTV